MLGDRLPVESSGALPLETVRDAGVRDRPDINALASRSEHTVAVLVWNYHDDDLPASDAAVELVVDGLPSRPIDVIHERIDAGRSNAYEAWKKMGSPQPPTPAQYRELERAGKLQAIDSTRRLRAEDGRARLAFTLPRQGVSLIRLTW
jgi:xylan 1,4-beta-xylosidase